MRARTWKAHFHSWNNRPSETLDLSDHVGYDDCDADEIDFVAVCALTQFVGSTIALLG